MTTDNDIATTFLQVGPQGDERQIAVRHREGASPGLVWLGGYRSDMIGTKAESLDQWAGAIGLACCRHDYSGHGESGGEFIDGTISRWLEESLAVFEAHTKGPQILIGSSMGAWIALRMVQELAAANRGDRVTGMVLIAPAPDFTHELMAPNLTDAARRQLDERGFMEEPSDYSHEPNVFTKALFDDGEANRVMDGSIRTGCPVHIVQGMRDEDVPHAHALKLLSLLPDEQVAMTLVKDGDHRLSRDEDIALLLRVLAAMVEDVRA